MLTSVFVYLNKIHTILNFTLSQQPTQEVIITETEHLIDMYNAIYTVVLKSICGLLYKGKKEMQ